jgi:hypothetical protein
MILILNIICPWINSSVYYLYYSLTRRASDIIIGLEHWQNCLADNQCMHDDVLVLRFEFNTAWNYFSAKELSNTVLGYWHSWLAAMESNTLVFGIHHSLEIIGTWR